ncbi:MAG: PEP-CTERM sorting domain-containing protein [Anaerolineae bacterium]|nr:PEP-CTERM sorting domain-containing protein [Phycisphaerae bacterium]
MFASALVGLTAGSAVTRADFIRWVGGNGVWGVATNWNPVGQPGPFDPVLIDQGIFTATHDDANSKSIVAQILLENKMTLSLSAGTLSALGGDDPDQYFTSVGVFGQSHYIQSGGLLEAPLGVDISGRSTFEISAGEITGTGETAGINIASQSSYVQSGGTNHLSLSIGGGTASITDGSLGDTTTSSVKVLFGGTLTQQGGVVTSHSVFVDTAGVYAMGGGTVNATTVTLGKFDETGATLSSGTFNQTGGTVWVGQALAIDGGQYALSNGTLQSSGSIMIGTQAVGIPSDATLDNGGTIVLNDLSTAVVGNGTFNHHGVIQKIGAGSTSVQIATPFIINGGTFDVQDGAVSINGNMSALAPVAGDTLVKEGPGRLLLTGAQDWQVGANLRLLGGETIITTDLGAGTAQPEVYLNAATLTLNASQSLGALQVTGGTMNIPAGTVSITANVSVHAPLAGDALVKEGPGTLVLSGAQDFQAGASLRLLGGETIITTDLGAGTARPDVRLTAASLTFSTSQSLGTLHADGASLIRVLPGSASTLMAGTLQLDADNGATLDLADNSLILSSTPRATVEQLVSRARNSGTWDAAGLTSSTAAAQTAPKVMTLAIVTGNEFQLLHGVNATFNLYSVAASDVLVKYTYYGDTDLNDIVDFDDYSRIDNGFNNGLAGWINGDFDFNAIVDFDDYSLIDLAFNNQPEELARAMSYLAGDDRSDQGMNTPGLQMVKLHFAQFGEPYAQGFLSAVPEPAAGFAMLAASAAVVRRRRRVG